MRGSANSPRTLFRFHSSRPLAPIAFAAISATVDLVAGHIEVYFGAFVSTLPHVKSGRVKVLGVTSARRYAVAPDLPTLALVPRFDNPKQLQDYLSRLRALPRYIDQTIALLEAGRP